MFQFTQSEIDFLSAHNVEMDRVKITPGCNTVLIRRILANTDYIIAAGGVSCKFNSNHRLRTSGGHCAQCKPAGIEFCRRWKTPGEIYIAHSDFLKLIKVGIALGGIQNRESTLNETGYGGAVDWKVIKKFNSNKIGELEKQVHSSLMRFRVDIPFQKNGAQVIAKEIFRCSADTAVNAIRSKIDGSMGYFVVQEDDAKLFDKVLAFANNAPPNFNWEIIFGMKRNLERGGCLSEKQMSALKNIAIGFGIV